MSIITTAPFAYRRVYRCRRRGCANLLSFDVLPARSFCAEHSPASELNFVAFHQPVFSVNAQLAFYLGGGRGRAAA